MHNVTIDELTALGCSRLNLSAASLAEDTAALSFSLAPGSTAAPLPWAWLEEVCITDGDKTLFRGYVTESKPDLAGGAHYWHYTLKNIVALLVATPAPAMDTTLGALQTRGAAATSQADMVRADALLTHALGRQEQVAVQLTAPVRIPYTAGSESCWAMALSALRWVPDAASWYDPAADRLTLFAAGSGEPLVLDATAQQAASGETPLFGFEGIAAADFAPRPDLVPPAVAVRGKFNMTLPENGNPYQPYGFVYYIAPERLLTANGSDIGSLSPGSALARTAAAAAGKWMTVRGRKVPATAAVLGKGSGDMKTSAGGGAAWVKFWRACGGMGVLAELESYITFGKPVWEPVPAAEAYPPEEDTNHDSTAPIGRRLDAPRIAEDDAAPANYKEMDTPGYVLTDGSFPASSNARGNVGGLHFCKGTLRQLVWISSPVPPEKAQAARDFFTGTSQFNGKTHHYTCLTLTAVFIDRRRKRYQEGTNALAPDDPDTAAAGSSGTGGSDNDRAKEQADYAAALAAYYQGTRRLYYDGTITLCGVRGYEPGCLLGKPVSVVGLTPDWAAMNTPVQRADYDPLRRRLTLTLGSPEVLHFNELLHRQQLARQEREKELRGAQGGHTPGGGTGGTGSGGSDTAAEPAPMISPSVNATHAVAKEATLCEPFQVYVEDGKHWVNGGVLPTPRGLIRVQPKDVSGLWKAGRTFLVKAKWDTAEKCYKPKYYYTD